ncbi:deoxynucleoside kinase [Saccharospirillum salsuginis]|uniref:Deoxynucleoside kinase domain-containing protein n=1 Tax=Saccharospirillum salsuginis TaxID=418750 RepID=A0A918KD28_9GAMM|nr:deoxynucleoside kinase [Saccharospirillum salsuginis]GGX57640.1 hypothetical protein GCM10007392_26550 [Saccharospirillum salsuginis]
MKSIAICGVDGSGKSTIVNMLEQSGLLNNAFYFRRTKYLDGNLELLKRYLPRKYRDARDWKDSSFGKSVGLGILMDFLRCYDEQLSTIEKYDCVVFDRYIFCYLAYINLFQDIKDFKKLTANCIRPNLILYIDAGISNLEQRYSERCSNEEDEDLELMEMFDMSYRRTFDVLGQEYSIIDNSGSFSSTKEQVFGAVQSIVEKV